VHETSATTPRRPGEYSAIEYFGSQGIPVALPIGHSPDYDLIVEIDGRLVRVQVKTASHHRGSRWEVTIATRGGNQSWTGVVKRFSSLRCDYLFVLVGDGRRWLIPSDQVDGGSGVLLGGPKYAHFEIERGRPFITLAAA
jgi:hypothetical protein